MKTEIRKSLLATAIAALGLASASAHAYPTFTVDPTAYGGAQAFTADKITGNYVETITFTSLTDFNVSIQWEAGQYVANNGTVNRPAAITGLGSQYAMYAEFTGSGTFNGVTFNLSPGGSLDLYLDQTVLTAHDTTTDVLLASGAAVSGTADASGCSGGGGFGCGWFKQTTSFNLTSDGEGYFIAPVPFYQWSLQTGQFNDIVADPAAGAQTINGSMDAIFVVPEPASLALFGIGLIGAGLSRRKRA